MKNLALKIIGGIAVGVVTSVLTNEISKRQTGKPLIDTSRLNDTLSRNSDKLMDAAKQLSSRAKNLAA